MKFNSVFCRGKKREKGGETTKILIEELQDEERDFTVTGIKTHVYMSKSTFSVSP